MKYKIAPYVHIFKDNNNYYILFNTLNLSIIKIKKDFIDKGSWLNDPEIYSILKERDFIIPRNSHPTFLIEFLRQLSNWKNNTLTLWISLTSKCNFKCRYCYLSYKPGKHLSKKHAKNIIEFAEKQLETYDLKTMTTVFYGGEPLLNLPVLTMLNKEFANFEKEYGISYSMSIITNGSLLSQNLYPKIFSFSTNNNVQITLDGEEKIHNLFRPYKNGKGSFSDVYANFINLVKAAKKYNVNVSLRVNINEYNLKNVKKLLERIKNDVNSLDEIPVHIGFQWIFPDQKTIMEYNIHHSLNEYQAKKLLELYQYAKDLGFKIPKTLLTLGPCMIKTMYSYVIDENLRVYKCPGLLYTNQYIGKIHEDGQLEINDFSHFVKYIVNGRKCYLKCEYGALCFGGCEVFKECYKEYFKIFISKEGLQLIGE